jgi:hypothetical protein
VTISPPPADHAVPVVSMLIINTGSDILAKFLNFIVHSVLLGIRQWGGILTDDNPYARQAISDHPVD